MANATNKFPVYEFRPLPNLLLNSKWYRFAEGQWIPYDGEYDLAFIRYDGAPLCLSVCLPYYLNIEWGWVRKGNWMEEVSQHPKNNAWHYQLRPGAKNWGHSWERDQHPNTKAGESGIKLLSERRGCANGRGPQFNVLDPYMLKGLVREQQTKKIVVPPKVFNCMYCGKHTVE